MRDKIQHGPIAWMASNPVAANLIMLICLVGGFVMASQIKQEVFPEFESDIVTVTVAYPGASPEEVEKGIVLAIEERVTGVDGVKKVTSSSVEGAGTVSVEALAGADLDRLAQDIKSEVDRITSFPEDAESPEVVIATNRRQTMSVAVFGDLDERVLREVAETVRDELLQDPEITQVDLSGVRDLEIAVEISKERLRAHGLTLRQVADIIGRSALELPGGSVKTDQGEILVRVKDRRDLGPEFAALPIITTPDGSVVRLEDLGTVTDGFEDTDLFARYNNQPAVLLNIYRVGDQTPISVSDAVKKHMDRLEAMLPPGVHLAKRSDSSQHIPPAHGPADPQRSPGAGPGLSPAGRIPGDPAGLLGQHGHSHLHHGLLPAPAGPGRQLQHDLHVRLHHHPGHRRGRRHRGGRKRLSAAGTRVALSQGRDHRRPRTLSYP